MANLESRLHELSFPSKRRCFVESLDEQISELTRGNIMMSHHSKVALERLIRELMRDYRASTSGRNLTSTNQTLRDQALGLRSNKQRVKSYTTLTEAKHKFVIKPTTKSCASKECVSGKDAGRNDTERSDTGLYVWYRANIVGHSYVLLSATHNSNFKPEPLYTVLTMHGKEITFSFMYHEARRDVKFTSETYFSSEYVHNGLLNDSGGVAIRKADSDGSLNFGGKKYHLGKANLGEYVLIYFTPKNEPFIFNFDGEMLFERLEHEETREKARLSRAVTAREKMNAANAADISAELMNRLKLSWAENPVLYHTDYGLEYIVAGTADEVLDSHGDVRFTFFDGVKKRAHIHGSKLYKGRHVVIEFCSNYTALYLKKHNTLAANAVAKENDDKWSLKGEMINCHEFDDILRVSRLASFDTSNLAFVSIYTFGRAKGRNAKITRTIGEQKYYFSRREVSSQYYALTKRKLSDAKYVGLLANTLTSAFEVLVIDELGKFTSVPAKPYSVTGSHRNMYSK